MRLRLLLLAVMVFAAFVSACATGANKAVDPEPANTEDPRITKARSEYFKGMGMLNHSNYEKAISHFEAARELNPQSYNIHMMLGKTYTRVGKHNESAAEFREAIKLEPQNHVGYDTLMQLYLFMGQPEKSLETAKAAAAAGVSEDKLLDLGWTYYQLGDNDKAEHWFNRYIELYGESFGPYRNLGLVSFSRGDYGKALEQFDKAEKIEPENIMLPYIMALTYEKLGMTDEASRSAALFMERDSNYMNAAENYNRNYFPHADPGSIARYLSPPKDSAAGEGK